jgi:hypothetical protein
MSSDLYVLSCVSIMEGRIYQLFSIPQSWVSEFPMEYTAELFVSHYRCVVEQSRGVHLVYAASRDAYEQAPVFLKESEQ